MLPRKEMSFEEFKKRHEKESQKRVKKRLTQAIKRVRPEEMAERMKASEVHAPALSPTLGRGAEGKSLKQAYLDKRNEFRQWLEAFNEKEARKAFAGKKDPKRYAAIRQGVDIYAQSDRWHEVRANLLEQLRGQPLPELQKVLAREFEALQAESKKDMPIQVQVENYATLTLFDFLLRSMGKCHFTSTEELFGTYLDKHFRLHAPPKLPG